MGPTPLPKAKLEKGGGGGLYWTQELLSLAETDPLAQSEPPIGHTKFVLEEWGSGECPTSFIPEFLDMIAKPSAHAQEFLIVVEEGYSG